MPGPGPTLRRRKLAKELIAARDAAGLSVRQLAAEIDLRHGTISKIENLKQNITIRNIRAIGRATGLSKAKIDSLVLIAANDETTEDWLLEFRSDMPEWFSPYPQFERDADELWTYAPELVHGLLQTSGYAEAVARAAFPDITDEQLRRSVELRKARQTLHDQQEPASLHFILNEAVVLRSVGGPNTMREQLRHLITMAKRPHLTIQVLPFKAGAHPGMKTGFTLLRFPEGFDDMDCVYLENDNGGVWQERPEDIERYTDVFVRLRSLALSPKDTADLLASLV
jgi:transcriptional regulator with XRE-family HTH domain